MTEGVFKDQTEFLKFAYEVVRYMPDGWRVGKIIENRQKCYLEHEDDGILGLDAQHYHHKGRIVVEAGYPHRRDGVYGFWRKYEIEELHCSSLEPTKLLKITVKGDTKPVAVVKAITNRLLPKYEPFWTWCKHQIELDRQADEYDRLSRESESEIRNLAYPVPGVYPKRVYAGSSGVSANLDFHLEGIEFIKSVLRYVHLVKGSREPLGDDKPRLPVIDWDAVLEIMDDNTEKALLGEAEVKQPEDAIAEFVQGWLL